MKRYIIMLIMVLFCTYTMYADAKEGNIEIVMPVEGNFSFTYSKVADIVNGEYVLKKEYKDSGVNLNCIESAKETQEAVRSLQPFKRDTNPAKIAEDGRFQMTNLEEGVYLVEGNSNEGHQVPPMLITIPAVNKEAEEMLYDITVMPKVEITPKTVDTSDFNNVGNLSVFFVISFIVVAILSCQKHFKCGRISE